MVFKQSLTFDISDNNWTDNNLFPSELYVDTNIALMLIKRQPNFYKVEGYLQEYAINRGNDIFWSTLMEDELFECIHVDTLKRKARMYGYNNREWKTMENELSNIDSANINQESTDRFMSAINVLKQYGEVLDDTICKGQEDNRSIIKRHSKKIYTTYGGGIKDATHLSIANEYGINNILTNDSNSGNGFLRYPQQNIFGISSVISSKYKKGITPNEYKDLIREEEPS